MRFVKFLLILVLFLFCLLFFTQNKEALSLGLPLKVDLFFADLQWAGKEVPYYFVALGCLAAGMIFATLFFLVDRIKLTYTIIEKKHKVARYESEIKHLNSLLETERKETEKARAAADRAREAAEAEALKKVEGLRKDIELSVRKEAGQVTVETEQKSGVFGMFRKNREAAPATPPVACDEAPIVTTASAASAVSVEPAVVVEQEKKSFSLFGKNKA